MKTSIALTKSINSALNSKMDDEFVIYAGKGRFLFYNLWYGMIKPW